MEAKDIIDECNKPLNDFFSLLDQLNEECINYEIEYEKYQKSNIRDVDYLKERMRKAVIGGSANELQ